MSLFFLLKKLVYSFESALEEVVVGDDRAQLLYLYAQSIISLQALIHTYLKGWSLNWSKFSEKKLRFLLKYNPFESLRERELQLMKVVLYRKDVVEYDSDLPF